MTVIAVVNKLKVQELTSTWIDVQMSDFLNFKDIAVKCIKTGHKTTTAFRYTGRKSNTFAMSSKCHTYHSSDPRQSVQPLYRSAKPPSIFTVKHNDFQDLCKSFFIKEEYHAFYTSLPHSASVWVMLPELDNDEDSE